MKSSIISQIFCLTALSLAGQDTAAVESPQASRHHLVWNSLMPDLVVGQYAGNMGIVSAGIGWDYGHANHWETQFLVGIIPKYDSRRAKVTLTLKENYVPWNVRLSHGLVLQPLQTGLYLNTVLGHEFWAHQPNRYPNGYYGFSTRVRLNVCLGQRITWHTPAHRHWLVKNMAMFYEVSSCDLYIINKVKNPRTVSWRETLCLSLGMQIKIE